MSGDGDRGTDGDSGRARKRDMVALRHMGLQRRIREVVVKVQSENGLMIT